MSTKTEQKSSNRHLQPPTRLDEKPLRSIFLMGSINMGTAPLWQRQVAEILSDLEIFVFNPRCDREGNNFDPTLEQDISVPKFKEQVNWELDHLDESDFAAVYFDPDFEKLSPITLLELGLHAKDRKLIVCCENGYPRKGNVQIVCDRYKIPLIETKEEFYKVVRKEAEKLCLQKVSHYRVVNFMWNAWRMAVDKCTWW